MLNNRKSSGVLLLAGVAAFAYYKYSKMSEERKRELVDNLKEKGKKWFDQLIPKDVRDKFAPRGNSPNNFGDGNEHTS